MSWIVYLLALVLFELVADVFSKQYSLSPSVAGWSYAMAAYVAANAFWLAALRSGVGLSRGAILFSVTSALAACLIGVGIYHEPLTWPRIAGGSLGIVAVVFLVWE